MHEVRRMITTVGEIFMNRFCSIKSLVYASMIASAFNRVVRKYCAFQVFLNTNFNNNNNKCIERSLLVSLLLKPLFLFFIF